jgi:hypothetical protein
MILQCQSLSEFVPIRVASWLVSSLRSEMPNLPILPILPQPYFLCVLPVPCPFCSSILRVFVATSQLCKTNPISKKPKPPQTHILQGVTAIFRSAPPEKTNPIKPNLSRRSPPEAGRSRIPQPCRHEIRDTQYETSRPAIRRRGPFRGDTTSEIRHTKYEIQTQLVAAKSEGSRVLGSGVCRALQLEPLRKQKKQDLVFWLDYLYGIAIGLGLPALFLARTGPAQAVRGMQASLCGSGGFD